MKYVNKGKNHGQSSIIPAPTPPPKHSPEIMRSALSQSLVSCFRNRINTFWM